MNVTTQRIRGCILDFIATEGIPPTVREIQQGCALSSPSVVFYHLKLLANKGLITWQPNKARTIRLAKEVKS